ncbi:MAG: response regulator [Fimbriimonadaceae bacterium]|nr:response regulator [Fimbriimonadaceae bacterium]
MLGCPGQDEHGVDGGWLASAVETAAAELAAGAVTLGWQRATVWQTAGGSSQAGRGTDQDGRALALELPFELGPLLATPAGIYRERPLAPTGAGAVPGDLLVVPLGRAPGRRGVLLADPPTAGGAPEVATTLALCRAFEASLALAATCEQRQERQQAGLRTVLQMADALLDCEDVSGFCRAAVETARAGLGVERCGVFFRDGDRVRPTFGTDLDGQTTDERRHSFELNHLWRAWFGEPADLDRPWIVAERNHTNWTGHGRTVIGRGWVAVTPIRARGQTLALLLNDTAISGHQMDPLQQDLLATFCAQLGPLLERVQLVERLRTSEARYREVVEDQTELICRFRAEGELLFVNEAYCRYFGRLRDELLGRSFFELVPPADVAAIRAHLGALGAKRPSATVTHRALRGDGSIVWQQWVDQVVLNDAGEVVAFQSVGREAGGQLSGPTAANGLLTSHGAAGGLPGGFTLQSVCQELDRPLRALSAYAGEARDPELGLAVRQTLEGVGCIARCQRDLLAALQTDPALPTPWQEPLAAPCRLREVLWDPLLALGPLAAERGVELLCQLDPATPWSVLADARLLRETVGHLLCHALHSAVDGHLVLSANAVPAADGWRLAIRVEALGSAWAGADPPAAAGDSLRLALADRAVAALGGRLEIDRREGRSTCWTVLVGLTADPDQSEPLVSRAVAGQQVWLPDADDPTYRTYAELLASWGVEAVRERPLQSPLAALVCSSPAAWPAVRQVVGELPVVHLIRCGEELPPDLGVVRLQRPIRPHFLHRALLQIAGASVEEALGGLTGDRRAIRVLAVEDNPTNRELLALMLEKRGYRCTAVSSGEAALELYRQQPFDVVLLDLQMPGMDGFEVAAQIRAMALPAAATVPIIAVTARAMREDRERCLEVGMDAYLPKPVRGQDLVEALETALRRRAAV